MKQIDSIEKLNVMLNSNSQDQLVLITFENGEITQSGLDLVEFLANNLDKLPDTVHEVVLNIPYEKLPKYVFDTFFKLKKNLEMKENVSIKFCVRHSQTIQTFNTRTEDIYWDFDTIVNANMSIDFVCDFLRSSNLSQLEMLAYIHHYVSNIAPYSMSSLDEFSWRNKDQFFAGAYQKSPEAVCTGYSSLMKEIVDNLNIGGLKCEILTLDYLNKSNNKKESHARCLVKIHDSKYGLNQAVFEDATWDNPGITQNNFSYAHFAMPNNSLDDTINGLYRYSYPDRFEYAICKAKVEIVDENLFQDNYNRSQNPINQEMIEAAFFNMLSVCHKDKSFDDIYTLLENMAKSSYEEQTRREFSGNLISKNTLLSKEQARQMFERYKKDEITDVTL